MEKKELNVQEQYVVELVREYQKGDREAYNKIYSLTYPGVYYLVFKMVRDQYEAQDITQEIYVNVYQNLKKLNEPQSFKKWLNRIAWHSTLDYLKSRKMNSTAGCDLDALVETDTQHPALSDAGEQILATERRNAVMDAVDQLSPILRTTVMLRFFNDLKEREIAEIMKVPLGTVKRRLMLAKKQLAGKLKGVYSVFPYFFLRSVENRQCGQTVGDPQALVPVTMLKRSALVAGLTAGTAAAVILQGPVIRNLKYYGMESYVNQQKVEWTVKSVLPIKSAVIEGKAWKVSEESGVYHVTVPENGEYVITVTDAGGQKRHQKIQITNIDRDAPIYRTYKESGENMLLSFQDGLSGINWEKTEFRRPDGSLVNDVIIDTERGEALLPAEEFPLEAQVEDFAGNYSVYTLQINTIEVIGEQEDEESEVL